MSIRLVAAVAAAVAALAAALAAFAMPAVNERARAKPFLVSGSVGGLFPGSRRPLRLTIRNPHAFRIRVVSLDARPSDAGRACAAENLDVTRLAGAVTVAARGRRRIALSVRLSASAPPACIGVTFPLRYAGRALRR